MDIFPPAAQRPALLRLASVIQSRSAALRRDECGDWHILGKRGHIYGVPGGYQFMVGTETARSWGVAKRLMAFARLTQDGDAEGGFILDRLPTADEAASIREALRIAKRRHLSEEQRQALIAVGFKSRLAA